MPITPPTRVIASHLRPLRLYRDTVYQLVTSDGDFVSRRQPDIYDRGGTPTTLNSKLTAGSIVRIEADERRLMTAVQLFTPLYDNPFARLIGVLWPSPHGGEVSP
jgi:hypothetical protein